MPTTRLLYSAMVALTAVLILNACTTSLPQSIRQAPANNPTLEQIHAQEPGESGIPVRWGGSLLESINREKTTELIILYAPLSGGGQPMDTENRSGRFIAIVPGFLEPSVYAKQRKITVFGNWQRMETRKIGNYDYSYPVVEVQDHHLWPQQKTGKDDFDDYPWHHHPWFYDPWFYPRYPLRNR